MASAAKEPMATATALEVGKEFLTYINSTPTPFHLVTESARRLQAAGFQELSESESWHGQLVPGGKYFYSRNVSTIVAFTVGHQYDKGTSGFKVVGAHSDSPVLKLKPVTQKSKSNFIQVAVECYGGGLWHTWFDRELTLAGSVIVETASGYERRLVHIQKPILRVPSLCIHLQSAAEREGFAPNKETHLQPILALVESELNGVEGADNGVEGADTRHAPLLLQLLAEELKVEPSAIKDLELSLCDAVPGQIWGARDEFISSPRIDNQVHCYAALTALLAHSTALATDADISVIVCFDHEECGSQSAVGAGGPIMQEAILRTSLALGANQEEQMIAIRKSFLISADVAHALHPNYSSKHDDNHQPALNKGMVIKTNDNQRYATNSETGFFVRQMARHAGVPVQEFMVRNDCPCGTTIGPIIAGNTGLRTCDVGIPSLSMHSIRETIGVQDVSTCLGLFACFFKDFRKLDQQCLFEGALRCLPCKVDAAM